VLAAVPCAGPRLPPVSFDGDEYQARFDALAAEGKDVHGEATFVRAYQPTSVLDAGCGTGRVAIELARHGVDVIGVDADASMIDTARRRAPGLDWREQDLTTLDLGRVFDVVVMAGNVPLFAAPGTQPALIAGCARHVAPGGHLIAGFQLDRGYAAAQYDTDCTAAGLAPSERFATWDREPYAERGSYGVFVYVRPSASAKNSNS
jgi:SAM-dependent methyltransferase